MGGRGCGVLVRLVSCNHYTDLEMDDMANLWDLPMKFFFIEKCTFKICKRHLTLTIQAHW